MATLKCRKLTLLDAIILVAATAAGLAWFRVKYLSGAYQLSLFDPIEADRTFYWIREAAERLMYGFEATFPLGVSMTLAVLVIRLRRPRADLRRLTRLPGFVAPSVVSAILVTSVLHYAIEIAFYKAENWLHPTTSGPVNTSGMTGYDSNYVFLALGRSEGVAVAACWFLAILGRRWHREPGWIDRIGLILGCYWIASSAVYTIATSYR